MAFAEEVKEYCNANDDDDLSSYISAAELYLTGAGIAKAEDNALYGLAVKMLVSTWYDNRVVDPSTSNVPQPYGLCGIINQLKLIPSVVT